MDEIAVERACRGERTELTRVERREAVRRLTAKGLTDSAVARRLRMSDIQVRAVHRRNSSNTVAHLPAVA